MFSFLKKRMLKMEERLGSLYNVESFVPLQLDINNSCNLSCIHCYHSNHSNVGTLDLNSWKKVVLEYSDLVRKIRIKPLLKYGRSLFGQDLAFLLEAGFMVIEGNEIVAALSNEHRN